MSAPDQCKFCEAKPDKLFRALETATTDQDTTQFRFVYACKECIDAKEMAETVVEEISLAN